MKIVPRIFLLFLILASFFTVSAVDFDPNEAYGRFKKGISLGGALFPTYEGEAFLLELDLYGSAEFDMLGFGVGLPVRFIVTNGKGDDAIERDSNAKIFPKEDWDDARDWVKILNYFHYGHSGDMFYFYFGEQKNRYVGNGSIVGAYYGDLRLYHPQRGVNLEINTDYAGLDFFMDDVTPPNVVGGRVYVKPISFLKESYGNNLEVGVSYFADIFAPDRITRKSNNESGREITDSNFQIFGFDASFRVLAMKYYQLTFYTDMNKIVNAGFGMHFGAKHKLMLPTSTDMQILSRWEVRAMEPDYIPSYFNTFYDIEREYYKGPAEPPKTKSQYIKSYASEGKDWTAGYYLDLVFDITGTFSVGGSFEHNKLYYYDGHEAKKYNNYQINVFASAFLFDSLAIDLLMTFQSLGEEGRMLKNRPYYRGSVTYYLNKFFSFGAGADSKWYLSYKNNGGSYEYCPPYKSFSIGAFAGVRF
ncbi:hypothetical protein J5681_00950 [bacterium]|nr:hypothetical protein [bacterium]